MRELMRVASVVVKLCEDGKPVRFTHTLFTRCLRTNHSTKRNHYTLMLQRFASWNVNLNATCNFLLSLEDSASYWSCSFPVINILGLAALDRVDF